MRILVIDDSRTFPIPAAVHARSSADAIDLIDTNGGWDEVYFEHNLAAGDTSTAVLDLIVERVENNNPIRIGLCVVHTTDPAGRDTIVETLQRCGYNTRIIDEATTAAVA